MEGKSATALTWRHFGVLLTIGVLFLEPPWGACEEDSSDRTSQEVRAQIALLSSADEKTRAAAARRLGSFGGEAAPAVPHLIKLLTDHPPPRYEGSIPMYSPAYEALESLVRIGKPAIPDLTAALDHEDTAIRTRAADVLGQIGDGRAKKKLLAMLDDESPQIRAQAALSLGKIGGPDTLEPLLAAAEDPHSLVRGHALAGLALCPGIAEDPRAVEPLLALFEDPRYPAKDGVARVLGVLKDRRAVEPLIAALTGGTVGPPWPFAAALGEIGDPRAIEPLIKQLDYPHQSARSTAVRALIQMEAGHRAYVAITGLFACEAPYDYSRRMAIDELSKVGEPAVPALTDALEDENPNVAEAAAATLRKIYGEEFDHGGKAWLFWKRDLVKKLEAAENAQSSVSEAPTEVSEREFVREARFRIPGQVQVFKFLVTEQKVIASVQYRAGEVEVTESPYRRPFGERNAPVIKSALAAWDLQGNELWKIDLPPAYHLVPAGNQVVLAYDGGGSDSARGLIWVDPTAGREIRRVSLPGRPAKLAFNVRSESLVMVLYPQRRLTVIDEKTWMEVRAYRMDGTPAWVHREPVSELTGFCLDGPAVVIGSTSGEERFVAGLDPLTGESLWRRRWGRFPAVPERGTPRPKNVVGLVCVPKTEGLEFLDPRNGASLHALPRPKGQRMAPKFCGHGDRVYYTSTQLEGFTLAAQAFPAGNVVWSAQTGTVSYGAPTAWGENTVFLCRRLSEGLTGHVAVTELRVYAPDGRLIAKVTKRRLDADRNETEEGYFDDTVAPKAVEGRLYLVDTDELVALRWETPPHRSTASR
ncbi:MAG TPA: HEAT repeat domain-containing protein [Thermoguttaceae bacterium]|nr:HEAT repeat domain-containing protein [Thermoguttaceae bacterium]